MKSTNKIYQSNKKLLFNMFPMYPDLFSFVTVITNPKAPPGSKEGAKSFNFDFSYWSHNVSKKIDGDTLFLVRVSFHTKRNVTHLYGLQLSSGKPLKFSEYRI